MGLNPGFSTFLYIDSAALTREENLTYICPKEEKEKSEIEVEK